MPDGATRKRIAILGSTGSIGTSGLNVARAFPDRLEVISLAAHTRWEELARQCQEFRPKFAVVTGCDERQVLRNKFPAETRLLFGSECLKEIASSDDVDLVLAAIVGAAGLSSTWEAVRAGKQVAVANKETFVVAGPSINRLAAQTGARIIPVDSEHSAVFQALHAGRREDVARIVLTASGGPFRKWSRERIERATVADALAHPTWTMGRKITIDSATMMNKALEIIEARWLFDFPAEQIDVVVHPQSVIHSLVEFVDGSVVAQMSPPDMRLPIQYAIFYPERTKAVSPRMDFTRTMQLDFEPPDPERFPALDLGFEVARRGGTAGAVLNAANEVAVERFLAGEIPFAAIPQLCREVLNSHTYDPTPELQDALRLDAWARQEAYRWSSLISRCS